MVLLCYMTKIGQIKWETLIGGVQQYSFNAVTEANDGSYVAGRGKPV